MRTRILIAFVPCSSPSLATASAQPAKKPARTTYDEHVLPILKDTCIGCHSQTRSAAG